MRAAAASVLQGLITGAGSGLTGGGTSGTLNLSLLTTCGKNQILAWSGSGWACSSAGAGTVTGVTAGTDLTGGGTGGNVTLNLNTAATDVRYAQLAAPNYLQQYDQALNGNTSADSAGRLADRRDLILTRRIQGPSAADRTGVAVAVDEAIRDIDLGVPSGVWRPAGGVAEKRGSERRDVYGVQCSVASTIGSEFKPQSRRSLGRPRGSSGVLELMGTADSGRMPCSPSTTRYGRPAIEAWNLNPATADKL